MARWEYRTEWYHEKTKAGTATPEDRIEYDRQEQHNFDAMIKDIDVRVYQNSLVQGALAKTYSSSPPLLLGFVFLLPGLAVVSAFVMAIMLLILRAIKC